MKEDSVRRVLVNEAVTLLPMDYIYKNNIR
jgi:hypothetical protein